MFHLVQEAAPHKGVASCFIDADKKTKKIVDMNPSSQYLCFHSLQPAGALTKEMKQTREYCGERPCIPADVMRELIYRISEPKQSILNRILAYFR